MFHLEFQPHLGLLGGLYGVLVVFGVGGAQPEYMNSKLRSDLHMYIF